VPCSDQHFIPILDEINGRVPPEPPSMPRLAGRKHGGRRPGAGAPIGNLNALKAGYYSARYRRLIQALAAIPEIKEVLVKFGARTQRRDRLAKAAAAEILTGLFQRTGQIVLNPQNNQVQNNQELLDFLRRAQAELQFLSEKQTRSPTKQSSPRRPKEKGGPAGPPSANR